MKTTVTRPTSAAVLAGCALMFLGMSPASARSWDYEQYRGGYDRGSGSDWYYDYYDRATNRGSDQAWRGKSDRQLKEDVQSELTWSPFVDADDIDVLVRNGEVTLRGTVEDQSEVQNAIENAYEAGAKRVISKLKTEDQD
jgi:hypothetical protein